MLLIAPTVSQDGGVKVSEMICGRCHAEDRFSPPVSVMLIFAPGLAKPYPLIPAEDYRICRACDAVFILIDQAVDSHPATREAGPWTRAVIVMQDGDGMDVKAKRQGQATA